LEKEKIEIEDQAQRIVDAIAAAGHSAVLLQRDKKAAEFTGPAAGKCASCQTRTAGTRSTDHPDARPKHDRLRGFWELGVAADW
jgi:hypothetical protein